MTQAKETVEVPAELLDLLNRSPLSSQDRPGQVRTAVAIHLFLAGGASRTKAAELAGLAPREFERLLVDLNLPTVVYQKSEYEQDRQTMLSIVRERADD